MTTLALPARSGTVASYTLGEPASLQVSAQPATSRSVYAAAHIVADPLRASAEGGPDQIDWDRAAVVIAQREGVARDVSRR